MIQIYICQAVPVAEDPFPRHPDEGGGFYPQSAQKVMGTSRAFSTG